MKRFMLVLTVLLFSFFRLQADESQYSAPQNLYASSIYYNDAILNWSASTLAQKWIVSYNSCGNNTSIQTETTVNHVQINSLVSGLVYNWKVQMVDINGDTTAWSEVETFQTLVNDSYCGSISNLTIDAMNQNGITVQWAADTTQTQWQIVYGELGSNPEDQGVSLTLSNYYYLIPASSLSIGDWYQIAVRTICDNSVGAWSFINTRFIASTFDSLPLRHTFEDDDDNNSSLTTAFGFISGVVNPWVIGSSYNATTPLDACHYSMYISSNGGQTNNYYYTKSSISYAYIDVLIPQEASSFYIDFKYRCQGESTTDGLKVYLLPSQSALDIKTLPNNIYQIGNSIYNNNDTAFTTVHIELPAQWLGQIARIAFAWVNDSANGGEGGAIIDDIYITARYCETPHTLTHNYVTSSSALVSWSFAENQSLFNVEYRPVNSSSWTQVNGVTSNYTLTGLTDNTFYYYRVQADCSEEASFFSEVDTFKTLITCLPPTNLHSPYYTNAAAIVTWNNDNTVAKWIIEYGKDEGASTQYIKRERYFPNDTLLFLAPDTYYNVRVRAISYQGDTSRYSDTLRLHTLCPLIDVYPFTDLTSPIVFTSSNFFNGPYHCWEIKRDTLLSPPFSFTTLFSPQLSFNWLLKDSINTATEAKVLISIDNAQSFSLLTTLNLTADTFASKTIDLSLFAGEPVVRLAFVPKYSVISQSTFKLSNFTIQDICQSPENINIFTPNASTAIVNWTPYPNNLAWRIALIDIATNDTSFYLVQGGPLQIINLLPLHSYKIMIKSLCNPSTLEDSWSESTFTTPDVAVCSAPANLTCYHYTDITKGDETIVVQWNATTTTSNRYELQYKEKYSLGQWNSILVNGTTHYNVRNLNMETAYLFRIRTICAEDLLSEFSDTVEVSLSSLSTATQTDQSIQLYPLPASHILNIEYSYPLFGKTLLINQEGQTIKQWQTLPHTIDVSSLAKGVYYLQIQTPQTRIQKKIIVN